jgi:hypothetical protein
VVPVRCSPLADDARAAGPSGGTRSRGLGFRVDASCTSARFPFVFIQATHSVDVKERHFCTRTPEISETTPTIMVIYMHFEVIILHTPIQHAGRVCGVTVPHILKTLE